MGLRQAVLKHITAALSPPGPSARLLILIYHRVLRDFDSMHPKELDVHGFRWQMELLAEYFNVLPLGEACRRLASGGLPERAACITFDDGYADNVEVALPVLMHCGLPATFFIATGFSNGKRMWNDTIIEVVRRCRSPVLDLSAFGLGILDTKTDRQRHDAAMSLIYRLRYMDFDERQEKVMGLEALVDEELPLNLMMTSDQVRGLVDAGMEIGGHTVNHPILMRLDDARAFKEIRDGKQDLEKIAGCHVTLFAYPNGKPNQDYDHRHVTMVKEAGFSAAVCTQWGASRSDSDMYQLPRFTPWHATPPAFHLALVRSYFWKNAFS